MCIRASRHCIEKLQTMLRAAPELDVRVAAVPEWTLEGLDEARVVQHELWLVQWADGRRGAAPSVPALAIEAPAKL